jgi:hypothetical protein
MRDPLKLSSESIRNMCVLFGIQSRLVLNRLVVQVVDFAHAVRTDKPQRLVYCSVGGSVWHSRCWKLIADLFSLGAAIETLAACT